jgi:branched-chain amino acid transport system permease protein
LPGVAAALVAAATVAVLPLFLSDTHEYRFAFVATFFIAALGLQILTGYAGQISLGHSGFMLVGAYVTTILSVDHGWNDLSTICLLYHLTLPTT